LANVPLLAESLPFAKLTSVKGAVLANQGKKFLRVQAGTGLFAGDRILALKDAHATIEFADGCALGVDPGKVVVIESQSPCKNEMAATQTQEIAAQDGLLGGDSPPWDVKWGWVVPATGIAGLAAWYVTGALDDDNDHRHRRTVSP
jgi:hypothetical protein